MFLIGMAALHGHLRGYRAAPNPAVLIVARIGQGAGSAMVTPTAIVLLLHEYPLHKRGLAIGIWGTVSSAGAAAGPTLGALAIEVFGWRPVLFIEDSPGNPAVQGRGESLLQGSGWG